MQVPQVVLLSILAELVQEVVDNFFVLFEVKVHLTKQLLIAKMIVIFRILLQLWVG